MTATSQPLSVAEGAIKVLARVQPLLPPETLWSFEGPYDDIFYMTFFGHFENYQVIREAARETLAELLKHDVPIALFFEADSGTAREAGLELRDLDWSLRP
jgi:hypothetical protein